MKKIFKFGCLPILGFLVILIGLFINNAPEEKETLQRIKENTPTIRKSPENAITQEKPVEPTPIQDPPVFPIEVSWDKTPQEQGLEVGDWISVIGHQDVFISAALVAPNTLEWIQQDTAGISLGSNASAKSLPTDRIAWVYGELKSPLQNSTATSVNNRLIAEETVVLRLIGKIESFSPPDEEDPDSTRWVIFLEPGVRISLWW